MSRLKTMMLPLTLLSIGLLLLALKTCRVLEIDLLRCVSSSYVSHICLCNLGHVLWQLMRLNHEFMIACKSYLYLIRFCTLVHLLRSIGVIMVRSNLGLEVDLTSLLLSIRRRRNWDSHEGHLLLLGSSSVECLRRWLPLITIEVSLMLSRLLLRRHLVLSICGSVWRKAQAVEGRKWSLEELLGSLRGRGGRGCDHKPCRRVVGIELALEHGLLSIKGYILARQLWV